MPDEHPILLHIEEGVARITLNRPPHNALNEQLLKELKAVTSQIEHNSDVWLVVVAGSGNKAFCAGGDLKWMHHKSPQEWNTIAHKLIQGGDQRRRWLICSCSCSCRRICPRGWL